jgi:DNA-directed RNA polymerase specialized sigma24 family protein
LYTGNDLLEIAELQSIVGKLIYSISSSNREILSLRYWRDLSMEQVADILGIALSAGKMRLQRAL